MKTTLISIVLIALLAAGFSSKNQNLTSVNRKIIVNDLDFPSLKKPDYKLVKELKALNTKATSLSREVNFYKESLVIPKDTVKLDSLLKKKLNCTSINKLIQ